MLENNKIETYVQAFFSSTYSFVPVYQYNTGIAYKETYVNINFNGTDYKGSFITDYKNLINFTVFVNKRLLKPILKNLTNNYK